MPITPRPEQQKILSYTHGTMGISAVPGSGKTFTLSALAADLIEKLIRNSDKPEPEQEILIVTFSNAAALNFSSRIAAFLTERGLLPGIGYKVCTLHSMALEIIRGHTQQLGIDDEFTVLDETGTTPLLQRAVDLFLTADQRATFDHIINPNYRPEKQDEIYREKWRDDLTLIAGNVISQTPAAGGGKVNKDSVVTLIVSDGPEPTPSPTPTPVPTSTPTTAPTSTPTPVPSEGDGGGEGA